MEHLAKTGFLQLRKQLTEVRTGGSRLRVDAISEERTTQVGHLDPNLMCPPCLEVAFDLCAQALSKNFQAAISHRSPFCSGSCGVDNRELQPISRIASVPGFNFGGFEFRGSPRERCVGA